MYMNIDNLELHTGTTTILAAWPGLGKTTAAEIFQNEKNVEVIDFDSGDFKDRHGLATKDKEQEFVKRYCDTIEELAKQNKPDVARVIMICTLPSIHNELVRVRNIDIINVYPYPYDAHFYTEKVRARAAADPNNRAKEAAAKFLLENDQRMTERYLRDAADTFGTACIFVGTKLGTNEPTYMSDVIRKGLANASLAYVMVDLIGRAFAEEFYKGGEQFNFFLDAHGRINAVSRKKIDEICGKKIFDRIIVDAEVDYKEYIEKLAYRGTDVITLHKADAANIMRMLSDALVAKCPESLDSHAAFGDAGISYERLDDRMGNLCYRVRQCRDGECG